MKKSHCIFNGFLATEELIFCGIETAQDIPLSIPKRLSTGGLRLDPGCTVQAKALRWKSLYSKLRQARLAAFSMEASPGSPGHDASAERLPASSGCSQKYESRMEAQRFRRRVAHAQETWESLCFQPNATSGRQCLGTPTTTGSSTELDVECAKEDASRKDCSMAEFPSLSDILPNFTGLACPLKVGGPQRTMEVKNLFPGERIESFADLTCYLRDLPPKNELQARALVSREADVQPPYGPVIISVWKVQLGETGRGDLKRDISERISAFPYLKPTVNAISKIKTATVDQLVIISEIVGLLKKTLRIAQRYELERTPFIRLLSAKRHHRSRAADSISSTSPDASSAPFGTPDEVALQRRAPRPSTSTQAILPPAKVRRRGTTLSKAVPSCLDETQHAANEHRLPSESGLQSGECVGYRVRSDDARSLLVRGIISTFGGAGESFAGNLTSGTMGERFSKHLGPLSLARPSRCQEGPKKKSNRIPMYVAAGMRKGLDSGEDRASQCLSTDGHGSGITDRCCGSYFLEPMSSSHMQGSYGRLTSSVSSPLDGTAEATEARLGISAGLSAQESMRSWVADILDTVDTPSQILGIVNASASKWTPSKANQLEDAPSSHRCAASHPRVSISSPTKSDGSAASVNNDYYTGNTVASAVRQYRLQHSTGGFFDEADPSDSSWSLAAELEVARNAFRITSSSRDSKRLHFSAATDSAILPSEVPASTPKRDTRKEGEELNNDTASSIIAVMLQNQRLRMDIKDHQRQAEAFACALFSLFKELLIQIFTELAPTVTSHVQALINEQAIRRMSQLAQEVAMSQNVEAASGLAADLMASLAKNKHANSQLSGSNREPAAWTSDSVRPDHASSDIAAKCNAV